MNRKSFLTSTVLASVGASLLGPKVFKKDLLEELRDFKKELQVKKVLVYDKDIKTFCDKWYNLFEKAGIKQPTPVEINCKDSTSNPYWIIQEIQKLYKTGVYFPCLANCRPNEITIIKAMECTLQKVGYLKKGQTI
jgi:hypothetical protein